MLVTRPESAHWPIDPARIDLAREFFGQPRGPHSDDLQRLLHRMRWSGAGPRHVLVVLEPNRRWMLARLPARRGQRVETFPNHVFTSLADAERAVFRLRWATLTGTPLPDDLRPEQHA
ncbi:MAG: hypothetical protein ACRYGM_23645 [Janthinobacterium lividum]